MDRAAATERGVRAAHAWRAAAVLMALLVIPALALSGCGRRTEAGSPSRTAAPRTPPPVVPVDGGRISGLDDGQKQAQHEGEGEAPSP